MQIWPHSHMLLKYFLAVFVTGLCFLYTVWFFHNKYESNTEKQHIARQAASYLATNQQKLNDTFPTGSDFSCKLCHYGFFISNQRTDALH